jgi:hypothetical protein
MPYAPRRCLCLPDFTPCHILHASSSPRCRTSLVALAPCTTARHDLNLPTSSRPYTLYRRSHAAIDALLATAPPQVVASFFSIFITFTTLLHAVYVVSTIFAKYLDDLSEVDECFNELMFFLLSSRVSVLRMFAV